MGTLWRLLDNFDFTIEVTEVIEVILVRVRYTWAVGQKSTLVLSKVVQSRYKVDRS